MRLTRLFTPSFTTALEALYPRLANAADWAAANVPEENVLRTRRLERTAVGIGRDNHAKVDNMVALPRMSKFILASFLASTNPAKTDLRRFGRGLDEKKKKKKGGGRRKGNWESGPAKVKAITFGGIAVLLILSFLDSSTFGRACSIPPRQNDGYIGCIA
jgi:origin recognition complex subunit 5